MLKQSNKKTKIKPLEPEEFPLNRTEDLILWEIIEHCTPKNLHQIEHCSTRNLNQTNIAIKLGISRGAVNKGINKLKSLKIITITFQSNRYPNYQINLEVLRDIFLKHVTSLYDSQITQLIAQPMITGLTPYNEAIFSPSLISPDKDKPQSRGGKGKKKEVKSRVLMHYALGRNKFDSLGLYNTAKAIYEKLEKDFGEGEFQNKPFSEANNGRRSIRKWLSPYIKKM